MIRVCSQLPDDERVILLKEHKANLRGMKNALKTLDFAIKEYSLAYRWPEGYHIWMEYEGMVMDVEKARKAVWVDFGEWGELDEILEEVVLDMDS